MELVSTAFKNQGVIPAGHSYRGGNVSPPLRISGVPVGTVSLALICDDPDAPGGTWVHWVVWNIDPKAVQIPKGGLPAGAVIAVVSPPTSGSPYSAPKRRWRCWYSETASNRSCWRKSGQFFRTITISA